DEAVAAVGVLQKHDGRAVIGEGLQALFAFTDALVRLPPAREIARHLGVAGELTAAAAQRRDHPVGPEAAAVLAQPPALRAHASFARCLHEHLVGVARCAVFGRIEDGELTAEYL